MDLEFPYIYKYNCDVLIIGLSFHIRPVVTEPSVFFLLMYCSYFLFVGCIQEREKTKKKNHRHNKRKNNQST